jgi:hypothetical protein
MAAEAPPGIRALVVPVRTSPVSKTMLVKVQPDVLSYGSNPG